MLFILLIIHVIITLALVGVILLQRSEGGGIGLGTGGGMSGFMTGRSAANFLTRMTAVLATCFIISSLVLSIVTSQDGGESILDNLPQQEKTVPSPQPNVPTLPTPTTPQPPTTN